MVPIWQYMLILYFVSRSSQFCSHNISSLSDQINDLKSMSRLRSPPNNSVSNQAKTTGTSANERHSLSTTTPISISQSASMTLKALLTKEKQSMMLHNIPTTTTNQNSHSSIATSASTTPHCLSEPTSPPLSSISHQQQPIDTTPGTEPLNTNDVSQKVRDLLNLHNIGQRIFAKYILGLSQGTVSELLSKPKHWDKLTEKGRESYRKMYTWSCSDESINALKAVSPRKGNKDAYFYQNGKEDSATEERIVQILNEAQKQMQVKDTVDPFVSNKVCLMLNAFAKEV
jgi:homeobox protein cut-like